MEQPELFGSVAPVYPEGFRYAPDVISATDQIVAVEQIRALPFKNFDFHGFEGKRRVVSFGWRYDFATESLMSTDPMPDFLLPMRDAAADFAGIKPGKLAQALVTEYGPGAPIGWHKDKAVFGTIIGLSFLSPCTLRLRRKVATKWERVSLMAEPGSAYVLSGSARNDWEHSIPPVEEQRYSITFRELRNERSF